MPLNDSEDFRGDLCDGCRRQLDDWTVRGCQMCGAYADDPCDCFDPQEARR